MKPLAVIFTALFAGTAWADLPDDPVEQLRFRIDLVDSIIADEARAVLRTGNPRGLVKYAFRRVSLMQELALRRLARPVED